MADHASGFRLPDELRQRLDALAASLSARAAGTRVTRSDVVRIALGRGVDALEHELDDTRQIGLSGVPSSKGGRP